MIDTTQLVTRLAQVAGPTHVSSLDSDRAGYGDLDPICVVWPAAAPEVARVLKVCHQLGAAAAIVGAHVAEHHCWRVDKPRVVLDTQRMTNILDLDEISLTVHAQCGIRLRNLEQALRRHGLTLGPFPTSLHDSTLGGALAAPRPTAYTPLLGRFVDGCLGVSVARADGTVIETRVAPRRATGPDLARLYLGSLGAFGVITGAVMRAHRMPERVIPAISFYPNLDTALTAARRILARGIRPARLRVIDEGGALREIGDQGFPTPAACICVLCGPEPVVATQHRMIAQLAGELGGSELPQQIADRWWRLDPVEREQLEQTGFRRSVRFSEVPGLVSRAREIAGPSVRIAVDQLSLHGGVLSVDAEDPGGLAVQLAGEATSSEDGLLARLQRHIDPERTLAVELR